MLTKASKETNHETLIMNPNISQHGNSPDFSISDRKKFLEGRSREATDAEHRLALMSTQLLWLSMDYAGQQRAGW